MYHMNDNEKFFYDNAGFSYAVNESPDSGHLRTAILLAEAERWAKRNDIEVEWRDDWNGDHSYLEQDEFDGVAIETCEVCLISRDGKVLASLGCIDNATSQYRRVVEAELASEVMG